MTPAEQARIPGRDISVSGRATGAADAKDPGEKRMPGKKRTGLLAKPCRRERVYDGVDAGVNEGQQVYGHFGHVQRVRVVRKPNLGEDVPDQFRSPAGEEQDDYDDECVCGLEKCSQ